VKNGGIRCADRLKIKAAQSGKQAEIERLFL
jgi:hypothetical protein